MTKTPLLKAYFHAIDLDHKFFDYLDKNEKREIENLFIQKQAFTVLFKRGNKKIAAAVFEVPPGDKNLHAREIAGNFPEVIDKIDAFAQALCIQLDREYVTFCVRHAGVKKIGKKLGYSDSGDGVFFKGVY